MMDTLPPEEVHPPGLGKYLNVPFYQADWAWLTNVLERDVCAQRHRIHVKGLVIVGPPKASTAYTVEEMEAMGYVALYHRIFDLEAALKPAVEEHKLCHFCGQTKPVHHLTQSAGLLVRQCRECAAMKGTGDPRGDHPILLQLPDMEGNIRG